MYRLVQSLSSVTVCARLTLRRTFSTPTEQVADFALHPRGINFLPKELASRYDKLLRGYDRRPLRDDAKRVSQALRDRSSSEVEGIDKSGAHVLFGPEVRASEVVRPTLEDVFNVVYGQREVAAYVAIRFPRVFAAVSRVIAEVRSMLLLLFCASFYLVAILSLSCIY